jgi:hypothetical protein
MVTRAGNTANSYTDQKSETDQDHSKIKVRTINAGSAGEEAILYQHCLCIFRVCGLRVCIVLHSETAILQIIYRFSTMFLSDLAQSVLFDGHCKNLMRKSAKLWLVGSLYLSLF